MQSDRFWVLWDTWSRQWYENAQCPIPGKGNNIVYKPVSTICEIKKKAFSLVYDRYEIIKNTVKDLYFKQKEDNRINRYKRAAAIAYAVVLANPLCVNLGYKPATCLLKQRLALYVALGSIIQDYPEDKVQEAISEEGAKVFRFDEIGSSLGTREDNKDNDDFLTSIYKDLYFAEIYENFNVLTFANMLQLLVEYASVLSDITPI